MRLSLCVVAMALLMGQALPAGAQAISARGNKPAESKVPADGAVITMNGFCDTAILKSVGTGPLPTAGAKHETQATAKKSAGEKPSGECKTEITRAQFETLSDATQPLPGPQARMYPQRNFPLAHKYPDALIMAAKALELGLDKDPLYQEQARFAQLDVLAQTMIKHLREESEDITDAQVEKEYKEKPEQFEEADLQRIFIPREIHREPNPDFDSPKPDPAADEAKMKEVANNIQKEAAAGGDLDKLAADAYHAAGMQNAPSVTLGVTMRDELPAYVADSVFALKDGQVSEVIQGSDGWYVFKVLSKKMLPVDRARAIIVRDRMEKSLAALRTPVKTTLNMEYFEDTHH